MLFETKQVLITVKAYPNPSKKYEETVCVAGIDLSNNQWIRLYPIPYRDLDDNKKFKKYDVVEIKAVKAVDDKRPESFKVDAGSIKILDSLATKNMWEKRKTLLLPTASPSFCDILEISKSSDKSLGMFKPRQVKFEYRKITVSELESRKICYAQLSFFNKQKNSVERIPFEFRYSFYCFNKSDCKGHNLPIIDWEIGQAFRSWRYKYRHEAVLLEKIRERWLDRMCSDKQDTYFFVGNMKRFRENFMVLGVFYPPKKE